MPNFSRLPDPLIEPLYVVLVLFPPARKLCPFKLTLPAPASEPMVSPDVSERVAPEATVTAESLPIALPPLVSRVPALIAVEPL